VLMEVEREMERNDKGVRASDRVRDGVRRGVVVKLSSEGEKREVIVVVVGGREEALFSVILRRWNWDCEGINDDGDDGECDSIVSYIAYYSDERRRLLNDLHLHLILIVVQFLRLDSSIPDDLLLPLGLDSTDLVLVLERPQAQVRTPCDQLCDIAQDLFEICLRLLNVRGEVLEFPVGRGFEEAEEEVEKFVAGDTSSAVVVSRRYRFGLLQRVPLLVSPRS
jgi:hypothetical protein